MKIKQLYTNCLAQGAYYISHKGEAVIIDPLRETQPYIDLLSENNDHLKFILETHFHADFVSGHVDLAEATGATIVFGPGAQTVYKSHVAADGEELQVGDLTLTVLHTPGHTQESACYLLSGKDKKPLCVFTGDTLFIGDVGRPDLAIQSKLTEKDLAGLLYDSLRSKLMPLPDDVIVYPAHGAGSACGKNMSKDTFDTLGNQKKTNYALRDISKEQFVTELTTGILPAPQYFAKNAALNKKGYNAYNAVLEKGSCELDSNSFENLMKEKETLVLDVRTPGEFAAGHIPGSMFVGLDGQFAPWVGTLIKDLGRPILLVTPESREKEAVMRLARVGYDNAIGVLKGGISAWASAEKKIEKIESISADTFLTHYHQGCKTLDVRKPSEYESGHLKQAVSRPLDFIDAWIDSISRSDRYFIHCAGGYRSMIAASLLKARGYSHLTDVQGGFGAISKEPAIQPEIVTEAVKA